MKTGRASKTALRVAIRRAAHQLVDQPTVLDDAIAVRLIGQGYARDMERAMHKVARDFRCYIAARSRYVEDRLAEAVARGVTQYIVLGAGLDTFAYRNPFPALRVFEVDFPATQEWKRALLAEAAIELPANLTFVPLDFEHQTLAEGLARPFAPRWASWRNCPRAAPSASITSPRRRRSARSAGRFSTGCRSAWLPPESLSGSSFCRKKWRRSFTAPDFSASSRWIPTGSTNAISKPAPMASSCRGRG
jgi:hypothetical protein